MFVRVCTSDGLFMPDDADVTGTVNIKNPHSSARENRNKLTDLFLFFLCITTSRLHITRFYLPVYVRRLTWKRCVCPPLGRSLYLQVLQTQNFLEISNFYSPIIALQRQTWMIATKLTYYFNLDFSTYQPNLDLTYYLINLKVYNWNWLFHHRPLI